MKKRLRKKFHLAEFTEFGFQVRFKIHAEEAGADAMIDRFIDQIETQALLAGGGGSAEGFDFFVTASRPRSAVTDADRLRLETWLSGDPSIVEPHIGPLVDAWNSR